MSLTSRPGRRAIVVTAVLSLIATLPAAAQAASVAQGPNNSIIYKAASGERNNVEYFVENGEFTVTDTAPLSAGNGCRIVAVGKARCGFFATSAGFQLGDREDVMRPRVGHLVGIAGEGGDDLVKAGQVPGFNTSAIWFGGGTGFDSVTYFDAPRGVTVSLDDQPGDGRAGDQDNVHGDVELINGSQFDDTITGNELAQTIAGSRGNDTISALGGNDTFIEDSRPNGRDVLFGGGGHDTVDLSRRVGGVNATLDDRADDGEPGEGDNFGRDIEAVNGGSGNDTITGTAEGNSLFGGAGIDVITGLGGSDAIFGGPGGDRIAAGAGTDFVDVFDGESDTVDCGSDRDTFNSDGLDVLSGCEQQVGSFRLTPRAAAVRAGALAELKLAWTHPDNWTRLNEVVLRLRHAGRTVGRITIDQETRRVRARGGAARVVNDRTAVAGRPGGRTMTARLGLRIARRYAGRTLAVHAAAVDDFGARQSFRRAGRIRVLTD